MSVPNIGQGPGSVAALPRTVGSGDAASPQRAPSATVTSQSLDASFTRLAWFDANGDGSIDPRSASAGGDATLLVPAHAVDLPTYPRPAAQSARLIKPRDVAEITNPTQANRAALAYQRYGQNSAPASSVTAAPASAPVVAAAPAVVVTAVVPVAPAATAATPSAVADLTSAVTAAPARAVA